MTESVVGKEEEERHQKLVTENEQLKRQIEEVKLLMSRVMRKPTFWFWTWSDTNRAVQSQKMARGLKFRI